MTLNAKAMMFLASAAKLVEERAQDRSRVIPSPCMSVCLMDPDVGLCQGCLRTLDEIVQWGNSDDAFKVDVWSDIANRVEKHTVVR
jgi:predicted Fe-S protein YdhL (DUF1289 family)